MMYYVATKNSDRRGKSKDAQILFVHIMFSGPTGLKKNAPTYTLGNNEIPGTAYLQQKVPIKSLGQWIPWHHSDSRSQSIILSKMNSEAVQGSNGRCQSICLLTIKIPESMSKM